MAKVLLCLSLNQENMPKNEAVTSAVEFSRPLLAVNRESRRIFQLDVVLKWRCGMYSVNPA
jgi:hypothetical protein